MKLHAPLRICSGGMLVLMLLAQSACDEEKGTGPIRLTDGQVVAIAMALNTGEIVTSEAAPLRATRASVREFAGMMLADHAAANRALAGLGITPVANAISSDLDRSAIQTEEALGKLSADLYDRAYIDAQIELHLSALDDLDSLLLPEASNFALRVQLQQLRTLIAAHLIRAEQIRLEFG